MNETLNVVVHEWAPNLNTSLENSNFKITDISIMLHYHYVIFQQTIHNVQRQHVLK
jgi:hypothetical protein